MLDDKVASNYTQIIGSNVLHLNTVIAQLLTWLKVLKISLEYRGDSGHFPTWLGFSEVFSVDASFDELSVKHTVKFHLQFICIAIKVAHRKAKARFYDGVVLPHSWVTQPVISRKKQVHLSFWSLFRENKIWLKYIPFLFIILKSIEIWQVDTLCKSVVNHSFSIFFVNIYIYI